MTSATERFQERQPASELPSRPGPAPRPDPEASEPGTLNLERAWIVRARAGDEGAFEAIFRTYYPRLCAFAEGFVGSSDPAEDLVEDVFVRTWENRESCRGCDSLKSYLYVAVRNRAFKLLRHRKVVDRVARQVSQGASVPAMAPGPATPEEHARADELAQAVERAIADLPERSRQAFLLHRRHGMSYAEIAAVMDVSVKTVENHLARAVKALRETLSPWVG